ncbi:MAG: carbohydrate ABC transporter permease [Chloroflexota bacterium]
MTASPSSGILSLGTAGLRVRRRARWRRVLGRALIYGLLVLGSAIFFLPFWWMLITSVKPLKEVYRYPPTLFPQSFTSEPYLLAWEYLPWLLFLRNTLTIVFGCLAGTILSATLCAYGFSRLRFRGRDLVFVLLLASMMLPSQVVLIPTYLLFRQLDWLDTFKPLIIPSWFGGGAFNIFLIRQFFTSIPLDMVDAARIDGSSELGVWWRIMLPLSKPALTAVAVFTIQQHWNDFFGPLIFLNSIEKQTLSLGLRLFQGVLAGTSADYARLGLETALMAASTVVTVPIIILFISAQQYFVEGIQMTGIKG